MLYPAELRGHLGQNSKKRSKSKLQKKQAIQITVSLL